MLCVLFLLYLGAYPAASSSAAKHRALNEIRNYVDKATEKHYCWPAAKEAEIDNNKREETTRDTRRVVKAFQSEAVAVNNRSSLAETALYFIQERNSFLTREPYIIAAIQSS